jgi:hypothetical protein
VRCPKCNEIFYWDRIPTTGVVAGATSEDPPGKYYPNTYSFTCPNKKCGAKLTLSDDDIDVIIDARLPTDPDNIVTEEIIDARLARHPEIDQFWMAYGRGLVNDTLTLLDDRAKNMITICASLIVVNFGLLVALRIEDIPIKVTPQFFFAISAALFVVSYFPSKKAVNLEAPRSIEVSYSSWREWKLKYQRCGFLCFIVGLFAIAFSLLL